MLNYGLPALRIGRSMAFESESVSDADSLRNRYLELLSIGASTSEPLWSAAWHLIVTDPWYQDQLYYCARKVLRANGASLDWIDDIQHDAMLILARHLRRSADMRLDRQRAELHFPQWLRTIIVRDCREAWRRIHRLWTQQGTLYEGNDPIARNSCLDLRIDLQMSLDKIGEPDATVVTLFANRFTLEEIASKTGLRYWQAHYVLKRGLERLRDLLARD